MFQSEKPFNMDQIFLERIDRILGELDNATILGNQQLRYRVLHSVYINTHFKFEKDRVADLNPKFKAVKVNLNSQAAGISKSSMLQHQSVVISKTEELLDELHFEIIRLLYENDIIYLKKPTFKSPEEEVAGDY